jgi:dienelactone hydrolase
MTTLTAKNRNDLNATQFAFPTQRKEPLENASHVRNAIARFNQVDEVTDAERDAAWKRIQSAARKYDVEMHASSWHQLAATRTLSKALKKR